MKMVRNAFPFPGPGNLIVEAVRDKNIDALRRQETGNPFYLSQIQLPAAHQPQAFAHDPGSVVVIGGIGCPPRIGACCLPFILKKILADFTPKHIHAGQGLPAFKVKAVADLTDMFGQAVLQAIMPGRGNLIPLANIPDRMDERQKIFVPEKTPEQLPAALKTFNPAKNAGKHAFQFNSGFLLKSLR